MQSIRPARPPMLESQEIPGVTPIQQKEALEADSIPHGPAFRGKSVSQSDLANNSASGRVVTEFGFVEDSCPPEGRVASTRTTATDKAGFVEASPSRDFRDGEGMFLFKLGHHQVENDESQRLLPI